MRLAAVVFFGALALSASSALAQTPQPSAAVVVSACGTPPTTYTPGLTFSLTQDTTGKFCDGAGGATGSTAPSTASYTGYANSSGALTGVSPSTPLPVVNQQQSLALVASNASTGSLTAVGGDYLVNLECTSYGSAGGVVIQQLEPDATTYQPLVAYTQTPAVAGVYTAGAVTASVNLPVTALTSGAVAVGQTITGTGISGTVTITAFQSGVNGGAGTYTMSSAQTISAGTVITAVGTPVGITLGGNAVVRAQLGTGTTGCILNLVRVP